MLGRVDPQGSLLQAGNMCGHLVTKGSFYEKLARVGHELITDDDFAHMYAPSRGRPSIPPSDDDAGTAAGDQGQDLGS